ncbi:MAG: glycosyltransferase [Paludibacteraceae bacterium]|nr:glycosyltransferase [Paludibacteraceae bacterium]
MSKVLIISAPFFGYQNSVGNAFKSLGFDVRIETYDEPIHPFKGLLRWRHKLAIDKEPLREKSRQKYKQYIERVFDEYCPDIVFTYNGTILKDSTLDYFRQQGAKVIVWMYDSVQRPDRAMCIPHIKHADIFCCFEETDVTFFDKQGQKAYFLPLACDTDVYYPQCSDVKDIDILFVGTIYTSPKRVELLEALVKRYPNKKLLFYGEYKPYFKNPISWIFRRYRNVFTNHNIQPDQVNDLFSRSKVALNIHHKQTFNGANQRLFEVCGARAYQICDANPYIEELFPNGEIGIYHNEQELYDLIDYALSHDMTDRAKAAYDIVTTQHTFVVRIKTILDKLL